mgnify:CR=1 FL=1
MSENRYYRRLMLCIEQFVCLEIDGGIQPILLIVESDRSLVNRNVIRTSPSFGL